MSNFWSWYIIVLTVVFLVLITWLLFTWVIARLPRESVR